MKSAKNAGAALSLFLVACGVTSPAARGSLREKLAHASNFHVESAVIACLEGSGYRVDKTPTRSGQAWKIHATKGDALADTYVQPEGAVPRVSGGPPWGTYDDPFWVCLDERVGQPMSEEAPTILERSKPREEPADAGDEGANEGS